MTLRIRSLSLSLTSAAEACQFKDAKGAKGVKGAKVECCEGVLVLVTASRSTNFGDQQTEERQTRMMGERMMIGGFP